MSNISGTFSGGISVNIGNPSGPVIIPTSTVQARLTLGGSIDANNAVKTQKSTNSGHTWADVTTYNSVQNAVAVAVVAGEHWRLVRVSAQTLKQVDYSFTCES